LVARPVFADLRVTPDDPEVLLHAPLWRTRPKVFEAPGCRP
jgi:hypothetical protein